MFPPEPPTPDPAQPATAPSAGPPRIQLSKEQLEVLKGEIERSKAARKHYEPWWEAVLNDYAPSVKSDPDDYAAEIHTLRAYTLVERKKWDLFYQTPEVTQIPSALMDGPIPGVQGQAPPQQPGQPPAQPPGVPQTVAVAANEEIVNELLGAEGWVDAKSLAHDAIFDILCTRGVAFTKLGYESVTVDQEMLDPMTQQPRVVPVPVYEKIYWDYIPPKQTLKPADFRSTNWDRAPWLGFQFTLPLTEGNRTKYHLPDDFQGSADATQHFDHGDPQTPQAKVFTGVELNYRSVLYRDDIVHPEHFTLLVLVDGMDEPAIHMDSPHQTFDAQGQLTPDSLIGNPIHPWSVRRLTDSSEPPSDCIMIRPLERELDVFRTQMTQYRDALGLRWQYNTDVLPNEAMLKMVRSPIGGMIGVPGDAFIGEGAIKELPQGHMPRESFTSNDYIDADIARASGVDASASGVQGDTQTATAEQRQQANSNARFDGERGMVLGCYLKGVTKYATLVMRYLSVAKAAQIVGPQRAQYWDAWRKTVPAAIAFTALPDSALRVDQASDRKQAQDLYSFLANDPYIAKGRAKLLEKLLRKFHIDPAGIVSPPDPPKPEQPKISLAIKSESLNPLMPEYGNIYQILTQQGIQHLAPPAVTPEQAMAIQQAQAAAMKPETTHGGKVAPQESLDKHHADESGGMQGSGAPAPLGRPGGMLQ